MSTLAERRQARIDLVSRGSSDPFPPDAMKAEQIGLIDKYWAIDADYAQSALLKLSSVTIAECIELQAQFDAKAREDDAGQAKPYAVSGGTAIIPILGPMTKKPSSASFMLGGTSTRKAIGMLNQAQADSEVQRAILLIDSPGGQVEGTAELGDAVREFAKPIDAYIEDKGMSAAFWVASQADAIYSNRTASVSSIGVRSNVTDSSQRAAAQGITVYPIVSGELKAAGEPGTKVTEKQLAYFTGIVNGLFSEFKSAVQTGRQMSDEQFAKVEDGRVILAREALALGLIDGICSFEECLAMPSGAAGSRQLAQANDPPPAPHRPAKEPKMSVLTDIIARIQGKDPEAAAALQNLKPEDLGATDDVTELRAFKARTETAFLSQLAQSHWDKLITPDADGRALATWAEKEAVVETFKALALMDGGGKLQFSATDGSFIVGPNLKRFIDGNLSRSKNALQAQEIPDADPRGGSRPGIRLGMIQGGVARLRMDGKLANSQAAAKILEMKN